MARSRTHHRPALIALVVVSAIVCLTLGWWQWERFESVGGDGQNLGYAFQWPLFAGFVVYAYRRFVQLEDDTENEAAPSESVVREVPADLLPQRPVAATEDDVADDDVDDPEARQLLEYNSYLAELDRSRE